MSERPDPSTPPNAAARLRRLEREHELDVAALEPLPGAEEPGFAEPPSTHEPDTEALGSRGRRWRAVALVALGVLLFIAGMQVGGAGRSSDQRSATVPGAQGGASSGGPAPHLVSGRVLAVAGTDAYVRVPGRTIKIDIGDAPTVRRAVPAARASVRPGQTVVAESTEDATGQLHARAITIVR